MTESKLRSKPMLLVDTGAWADFLGTTQGKLGNLVAQAIASDQAAICGVVIAELLQGAMANDEQKQLDFLFANIQILPMNEDIMIEAGNQLQQLSKRGIELPLSYAVIAAIAKANCVVVLTDDSNFSHFDIETVGSEA